MADVFEKIKNMNCVNKAIWDAVEWKRQTGEDTMIAVSKIEKTANMDKDHVQAVSTRGGGLFPLTSHEHEGGKVREWGWHFPDKQPYEYKTVDQFILEQEKNIHPDFMQYLKGI
jgi:hypothetical protein